MPDQEPLDLLRSQSGLSIDAEGRFLHRGEPITHARTLEVLWRSLERAPDGRYLVRIGRESAWVRIEDAPYTVLGVLDLGEGRPPTLLLSDRSREVLDPATLSVGDDGVLRCEVKGRAHPARFSRAAQIALGLALDEDPPGSGRLHLAVGAARWSVRQRPE